MRRFVTLAVLLLFSVPFGISLSGCHKATPITYCGGGDSGVSVGQITTITLQPRLYGISLAYGQKGQINSPAATDCQGTTETATFRYGTTDMTLADVNPTTGALCAGTWNRNTGGAVADYTVCNLTNKTGVAYVTAAASGTVSNPVAVYIHPIVTSVVLGSPSVDCVNDPATNCNPAATDNTTTATVPYNGSSCFSQGTTAQVAARVYENGKTDLADNISLSVGHLTYSPQTTAVVTIDENGVATSVAPGSTIVSATVAGTSSSAGFFSTCPPASIVLTNPGSSTLAVNNTQPLTAIVLDTNTPPHPITGLSLEYQSTTPTTIAGVQTLDPSFPGTAAITAVCQPGTCNPSPFNQIGLFGNGKPVTSNPVTITTPGTSGTILYIASTQSRYIVPVDFTTTTLGTPVLLPYAPNSMVISNDGSSIYMGSSTELMVYSAISNGVTGQYTTIPGNVLAVSPDGNTLVVSDPVRQVISLVAAASGGLITTYGGVGTRAQWSPDSQAVYIAAGNQLLVYSTFTGWDNIAPSAPVLDVAVTVPAVGAYFAGTSTTARGYCSSSVAMTANGQTTETNTFYPLADSTAAVTDRVAATNDGKHIIGASASNGLLSDLLVSIPFGQCPTTGGLKFASALNTVLLPGVKPVTITGIVPASDSSVAFVTYTGTGGVLPAYIPPTSGKGAITPVKLSGTAIAPVSGVFSTDNLTFYAGTSGDNLIHIITRSTLTDTTTIAPKLLDPNGNVVAPNLLVQRPRKTTS